MPPRSGPDAGCLGRRVTAKALRGHYSPPGDHAGIARRWVVEQLRPYPGAEAIGSDHEITPLLAAIAQADCALGFVESLNRRAQPEGVRRRGQQGIGQHFNQVRAVDVDVGCAPSIGRDVAHGDGKDPPTTLPQPHFQRFGQKPAVEDFAFQAQRPQHLHPVRRQLDPCTHGLKGRCALEHLHRPATT